MSLRFSRLSTGDVAESVDAMVSKTIGITSRVGSSPTLPIQTVTLGQFFEIDVMILSYLFSDHRPLTADHCYEDASHQL